jgi:hypothetical protein
LRVGFQQLLTEGQKLFPAPIREEARKANPNEPMRQDVEHESTQELFRGHRHLAAVSVVPPAIWAFVSLGLRKPPVWTGAEWFQRFTVDESALYTGEVSRM